MATKQFIYPQINPLVCQQLKSFDSRYNSVPFDYQTDLQVYFQKRQTNDIETIQVLSDWVPTLYVLNSKGYLKATINPTTPVTGIVNQTYTCYEFIFNWSSFTPDNYYIEIRYTDDSSTVQVWQSRPIQLAVNFPQTLLIQYTNSVNKFSTIFNHSDGTILTHNLRVEGNIPPGEFTPAFEAVKYTDEEYIVTNLNTVPRREFSLYIGSNRGFTGIPSWLVDKVNWALACDQIMIDGTNYQTPASAKWEIKRTDALANQYQGGVITLVEVNNLFLQSLKTGTTPPQGFQVVELATMYKAQSANFSIANVFKKYSLIKNITVINNGSVALTLNVGITNGGSEIGSFAIPVPDTNFGENININLALLSAQTIYVSGISAVTGANVDVCFDYCQYDAVQINLNSNTTTLALPPRGTVFIWEGFTKDDFLNTWDLSTGLAKTGTDFYGCALCDGRNGTVNRSGTVALCYALSTDASYSNLTTDPQTVYKNGYTGYDQLPWPDPANTLPPTVGTVKIAQTRKQMPPHSHPINSTNSTSTGNNDVDVVRGNSKGDRNPNNLRGGTPGGASDLVNPLDSQYGVGGDGINDVQTIGISGGSFNNTGKGDPMENRQPSIISLFVKRIF